MTLVLLGAIGLGAGCGQQAGSEPAPAGAPTSTVEQVSGPVPAWELLDCPEGERSVWMTDPGRPDPGVTIADVVARLADPPRGVEASLVDPEVAGPGEVVVALVQDGRTVAASHLDQWGDRGGWYVEGGVNCPGHGLLS